jgi:hypothetical protein
MRFRAIATPTVLRERSCVRGAIGPFYVDGVGDRSLSIESTIGFSTLSEGRGDRLKGM